VARFKSTPGAIVDGPSADTDLAIFAAGQVTLANAATLLQGQVLCKDVTKVQGANFSTPANSLCDQLVKPSSANAGLIFGVYQGPTITNSTGSTQTYTIDCLQHGYGLVSAQAKFGGVAVKVGDSLILNGTDDAPISGTAALNLTVGMAVATAAVTAKAATIIATPGSGATVQSVQCDINIR
jgi:hypothetical protein